MVHASGMILQNCFWLGLGRHEMHHVCRGSKGQRFSRSELEARTAWTGVMMFLSPRGLYMEIWSNTVFWTLQPSQFLCEAQKSIAPNGPAGPIGPWAHGQGRPGRAGGRDGRLSGQADGRGEQTLSRQASGFHPLILFSESR